MMTIQKPIKLDDDMKRALKKHVMFKRRQLKLELEQDASEKKLKQQQEMKRKQDAMTLDQIKEQLTSLQKHLEDLQSEKRQLFAQLKENMRICNEDEAKRKHQEEERIVAQNKLQQQINQAAANQRNHWTPNQQNPLDGMTSNEQANNLPLEMAQQQVFNQLQRAGTGIDPAAYSHFLNSNNFGHRQPFLPASVRSFGPITNFSSLVNGGPTHQSPGPPPPPQSTPNQGPSLMSGIGIPTSVSYDNTATLLKSLPSTPPSMSTSKPILGLPISTTGPFPTQPLSHPFNLPGSTNPSSTVSLTTSALGIPSMAGNHPFFTHMQSQPTSSQSQDHLSNPLHPFVINSLPNMNANSNLQNVRQTIPDRVNPPTALKRPLQSGYSRDNSSPSKKPPTLNQVPPTPPPPTSLYNPYFQYGVPAPAASYSASTLDTAAYLQLLQNLGPRHSHFLGNLAQQARAPSPYSIPGLRPFTLGHMPSPSLISGHGIPTTMSQDPRSMLSAPPIPPSLWRDFGPKN